MKKKYFIPFCFLIGIVCGQAQLTDTSDTKKWEMSADLNLYIVPQESFLLPVFRADRRALHLEGRYNYEDYNTFSAWAGYNLGGENNFEYAVTPMIGGAVGNTNGIAVGLELTLNFKAFELYSEAEYLLDASGREYNYIYSWTDFTFSPKKWLWIGISAQRTRLIETPLDFERGILLGASWKNWELSAYAFNLGFDEPYGLLTLSFNH